MTAIINLNHIVMKKHFLLILSMLMYSSVLLAQVKHTEKFEQLESELRAPNVYRNAAGAPGPQYWQNEANYDISVELDDENQRITGEETITYINNSPDELSYLWMQLDQNVRAKTSHSYSTETNSIRHEMRMNGWGTTIGDLLDREFEGGFNISEVKDLNGKPLQYTINKTMMVIDLPQALRSGERFSFSLKWDYNINDRINDGGRSGYEYFEEDDNYAYTIAQFYPRMCVYNDVDGWQNKQFLGSGEFTVPFGNYIVKITAPADHVIGSTGKLQNPQTVLTEQQIKRWEEAKTATEPVMIITQKEAEKNEKSRSKEKKTWIFQADDVRDFAFASSRKFIWDAMGVNLNGKTVMAVSYYPKEGNPLWEEYSTRVVAHTLKVYSRQTIDYPYHKAISVHAARLGMEYPMICFNFGRPDADGTYSKRVKESMIMVIIHEVGHNFFPMIVNSDERQWAWMDEGLNSFMQYIAEREWKNNNEKEKDYEFGAGPPQKIVPYMKTPKEYLSSIMTNPEQVINLGGNAYDKPATALNILRETIMGPELFDRAFKEYSRRWAFKHPTPADFFRTMEDASAVDLDWFWKGWFYGVDNVDIAMTEVNKYKMEIGGAPAGSENQEADANGYKKFFAKLTDEEKKQIDKDLNFYELKFENKGGVVMPIILEFTYTDGSKEIKRIPAEIWRKNAEQVSKVFTSKKELQSVVLDPMLETADVDLENNYWPINQAPSRFENYLEKNASGGN